MANDGSCRNSPVPVQLLHERPVPTGTVEDSVLPFGQRGVWWGHVTSIGPQGRPLRSRPLGTSPPYWPLLPPGSGILDGTVGDPPPHPHYRSPTHTPPNTSHGESQGVNSRGKASPPAIRSSVVSAAVQPGMSGPPGRESSSASVAGKLGTSGQTGRGSALENVACESGMSGFPAHGSSSASTAADVGMSFTAPITLIH